MPLTLDEVKKVLLSIESEQPSNIHQLNVSSLKTDLVHKYFVLDNLKTNKSKLDEQIKDAKDEDKEKLQTEIEFVNNKIKEVEKLIKENDEKLKEVKKLKSLHSTYFEIPEIDENATSKFSPEDAVFAIGYFKNDGTMRFSEFYSKICVFAEHQKLNEKGIMSLLTMLLQNEPYSTFMEYRNKKANLTTILEGLNSRYSDKKTFTQYMKMLQNISRKPNETLRCAMSRASHLISMTNSVVALHDRDVRQRLLEKEYLLKLANSNAKREVEKFIRNSQREGLHVTYDQLLNIAADAEMDETYSDFSYHPYL